MQYLINYRGNSYKNFYTIESKEDCTILIIDIYITHFYKEFIRTSISEKDYHTMLDLVTYNGLDKLKLGENPSAFKKLNSQKIYYTDFII